MTTIYTVAAGDPIRAADHDSLVALLKGTAGSAEQVALLGNLKLAKGADIASATTLTPGADGNYFHVTGTVTVTGIATVIASPLFLEFDGAVLLTHSSALFLQGSTNYTTAAGDMIAFISEGTTNWRELFRRPASASGVTSIAGTAPIVQSAATGAVTTSISAATVSTAGSMSANSMKSLTQQAQTGGTVTVDFASGLTVILTSNNNLAITLSNGVSGQYHSIVIKYGGSHSVTFSTTVVWDNATTPTWQAANGKVDLVVLFWDGTTWRGALGGKFAS